MGRTLKQQGLRSWGSMSDLWSHGQPSDRHHNLHLSPARGHNANGPPATLAEPSGGPPANDTLTIVDLDDGSEGEQSPPNEAEQLGIQESGMVSDEKGGEVKLSDSEKEKAREERRRRREKRRKGKEKKRERGDTGKKERRHHRKNKGSKDKEKETEKDRDKTESPPELHRGRRYVRPLLLGLRTGRNEGSLSNSVETVVAEHGAPSVMRNRVAYLRKQLEAAEASMPAKLPLESGSPEQDTELRVMVAPEWMFRRAQPPDIHDYPSANALKGYLKPLSAGEKEAIVRDLIDLAADYPDWLIVPGTIFFSPGKGKPVPVMNVAPVLFGGLIGEVRKVQEQDLLVSAKETWVTGGGSTRFVVGPYNVAVEICRDHAIARAALESADLVDLQIVTSNGVLLNPSGVAVRDGGLFIQVDALGGTVGVYRVKRTGDPRELAALQAELARLQAESDAIDRRLVEIDNRIRALQNSFWSSRHSAEITDLKKERQETLVALDKASSPIRSIKPRFGDYIQLVTLSDGSKVQTPGAFDSLDEGRGGASSSSSPSSSSSSS